jgi:hypothetical protein
VQVCLTCQVAINSLEAFRRAFKHALRSNDPIHIRRANCSHSLRPQNPGVNFEASTFHQPTPPSLNHLLYLINGTVTTIRSSNKSRTTAFKFSSAVGKPKVGATGYSDKPTARDIAQDHILTSVKELSRPHTIMSIPPQLCQAQGV